MSSLAAPDERPGSPAQRGRSRPRVNLPGRSSVSYGVTTMPIPLVHRAVGTSRTGSVRADSASVRAADAGGRAATGASPPPTHDETVDVVLQRPARDRAERDGRFATFMRENNAALLQTAWLLTGDAHRAEELTQQALVRTYAAWDRVEQDPLAYARKVLVNLRVDTWRRRRREVLTDQPPERDARDTPDAHGTTHDRDQLVRALALLTPAQRRIVVLRHLVGLPEAEVAAELGVSLGTVKSTASRGLARLREVLADERGAR